MKRFKELPRVLTIQYLHLDKEEVQE
jgi:hypothetical protein